MSKTATESKNMTYHVSEKGKTPRYYELSDCGVCGTKRSTFISKEEAKGKGLITDIIGKFAPNVASKISSITGNIPLIGALI